MICQFCGNVLPDNATFCGKCGANIDRSMQQGQPAQPAQPAQPVQMSQPVSQAQSPLAQPVQPSQPVSQAQNLYGQPASQPVSQAQNLYGQPSQPAQPVQMSQPVSQAQNLYGQPSQPAQPTQMSQPVSQAQNLYGQPAQMSQPMNQAQTPYGQPAQMSQPMNQAQTPYGQPAYQQNSYGQPAAGYNNQTKMTRKEFNDTYLSKKTKGWINGLPIFFIVIGSLSLIGAFILMGMTDSSVVVDAITPLLFIGSGIAMKVTGKPILYIVMPAVILVWLIIVSIVIVGQYGGSPNLIAFAWPILAFFYYKPNKIAYEAYEQYVATGAVPSQLI